MTNVLEITGSANIRLCQFLSFTFGLFLVLNVDRHDVINLRIIKSHIVDFWIFDVNCCH